MRALWASGKLAMWCDELESSGGFDPGASLIKNFDLNDDGKVGFPLFFCDFQSENAEIAPFFVHLNKK